jgi:hypothetical protein
VTSPARALFPDPPDPEPADIKPSDDPEEPAAAPVRWIGPAIAEHSLVQGPATFPRPAPEPSPPEAPGPVASPLKPEPPPLEAEAPPRGSKPPLEAEASPRGPEPPLEAEAPAFGPEPPLLEAGMPLLGPEPPLLEAGVPLLEPAMPPLGLDAVALGIEALPFGPEPGRGSAAPLLGPDAPALGIEALPFGPELPGALAGPTIRPAPNSLPPYDGEPRGPRLRLVHTGGYLAAGRPSVRRNQPDLPPARQWLDQLLVVVLECLEGWRPLVQLRAHASPLVIGSLASRRRQSAHRPNAAPLVRSLHLTEPNPGVVEACAIVNRTNRVQALAIRIEVVTHRWWCTALSLVE